MSDLVKAGFYSALFTIYGGSFYFLVSFANALASNGDTFQSFVDTLLGCLVCWVFGICFFYEIGKAFDELNKSGRKPDQDRSDS